MQFTTTPRRLSLVALAGVLVFCVPTAQAAEEKDDKAVRAAHIKLSGDLEERPPSADPLTGSLSESFHTKLDRLRKAKNDKEIKALFLEIDGLSAGWGKIDELTRAITDVRASGKKVYAYLESGAAKDYATALSCDVIVLPEAGWLMLTGIRMEVSFYKDLFEKIGVQADMLHIGDFKGAAEPFTRTSLSEPNKKQLNSLLDDFYDNSLVDRIVKGRKEKKFTAADVKKLIDAGPYAAKAALEKGLVDHVGYSGELEKTIKEDLKSEEIKIVKNYGHKKSEEIDFSSPFAILKLLSPIKITSSTKPKIAVIYASGAIVTGKSGGGLLGSDTVGSETMVKAIRQADADETVKAIVLRVDSPGGSALASDLIWHELVKCKKPVIASMSDVAASGGYYISMAARKIYAEPGTITGSIGVVGGKLALGGVWDKVGIKTEVLSRGAHSGILSTHEPFSDSERKTMHGLMKDVYDQFVDKALAGRKKAGKEMTRDQLEKLAGGRVYTGRQAKANGLIDELGTLGDAIKAAKKEAHLDPEKEMELLELPKSKGFLDALLEGKADTRLPAMDLRVIDRVPGLKAKLRPAEGLLQLRSEPVWLVLPYHLELK
jgi:protease IV